MATGKETVRVPTENEDSTQKNCTSWLLISCVILSFTTAFVFGWGLGAPNMYNSYTEPFLNGKDACDVQTTVTLTNQTKVMAPVIDNENVDESETNSEGKSFEESSSTGNIEPAPAKTEFNFKTELIKGIPQSVFLIGAFLGALTGPFWVSALDRKRTVFANYIFSFASSLFVLLSYYKSIRILFYLSRLVLGYQGGMACVIVPPYINEIASRKARGTAGAVFQLALTIGILVAQLVGLPQIAGHCQGWGWGLSIVFLLPLAGIFPLLLLPNSPPQMVTRYGDEDQASADLRKLRGTSNIQADLEAIRKEANEQSGNKTASLSIIQVISSPRYRTPMLVTVVLQLSQALSGINAVFFYSSKMFAKAGISEANIPLANFGTGLINVVATIVSIFLIEKLGRRPLIIYPMALMVVVFGFLTALVQINETRNSPLIGSITVVLILVFIVCFAIGLGPIPFLYGGEVCRQEARDSVQSLGLVSNYLGNILLSLFFPLLNSIMGGYVFLIFLVLVLINVFFLYFKMVETRNKKIDDVEREWGIKPATTDTALLAKTTTKA